MTQISKQIAFSMLMSLPMAALCSDALPSAIKTDANMTLETRVQALLTKVKRSLRPLKSGTFEMGDWGNKAGVPYDFDARSRPLHKVTLDGFSMMAYKVTFDDFDVFTDATGHKRITMRELEIQDRAPNRSAGVSWYGAGEWVNDWFDKDYYKDSSRHNPTGPITGTKKVMRGSVEGKAEIAAMVFMRAARDPRPMESKYPNGIASGAVLVPMPIYTGYPSHNFRCALSDSPELIALLKDLS